MVKVPLLAVEVSKNCMAPPGAPLERGAVGGEGSQAPRGRAVGECYRSKVADSINISHKVLCGS